MIRSEDAYLEAAPEAAAAAELATEAAEDETLAAAPEAEDLARKYSNQYQPDIAGRHRSHSHGTVSGARSTGKGGSVTGDSGDRSLGGGGSLDGGRGGTGKSDGDSGSSAL